MKPQKPKVKIPEDEQDEDSEDEEVFEIPRAKLISKVVIGDLAITSKAKLSTCEETAVKLLKNQTIKKYLRDYGYRKFTMSLPSYLG